MTDYLRRAARWVMWSPVNALGTLALVAAVILIAVLVRADHTAAFMRATPPPIATSGPMPPVLTMPALVTPPPADPHALNGQPFTLYEVVASAFVSAWGSHISPSAWHQSVDFLSTPALAKLLDSTDPASVPARTVISTGDPTQVSNGGVNVLVATDAGTMSVTMVKTADRGWLVSGIERYTG